MKKEQRITRREFIKKTGAVSGAAFVTASVGPFVHTTMAKGKTLRICSYGGDYQASQRRVFFEPFASQFGVKIIESSGPGISQVKTQVDNKAYKWDVVDLETRDVVRGELQNLLEPVNASIVKVGRLHQKAVRKASVGNIFWSTCLAYNKKALAGKRPAACWADFWNVKKFPGPRALQNKAIFNLEFALLADGVSKDNLYPLDLERAFKNMDKIKNHITFWWQNEAQQAQLLTEAKVSYSSVWNEGFKAAQNRGAPLEMVWEGGCMDLDWWCIPKGNPNKELAMKFIHFALSARRQAKQAEEYIAYGPTNKYAFKYISEAKARQLPSYPDNMKKQFVQDAYYWGARLGDVTERWRIWMTS
jgi:putative spermidine/putrescine transport system substrate-binding protein